MIFLEDRAGIRIPAGEVTLADFDTLRSCLAVVARRTGPAASR